MPHTVATVVRSIQCLSLVWLALLMMTGPSTVHAYQCGDGNHSCSLKQLASFLDRIKLRLETHDAVYDQIYSEGVTTIVFIQRLKHRMDKSQRKFVEQHGANKASSLPRLCSDKDLLPVLQQGLQLKYIVQDFDQRKINTFTVEYSDCVFS